MPGRATDSSSLRFVGAAVAVVAVIGYVVFGWRFGGDSGTVPTALAVLAVAVGVGVTLYRRLR
jgi:hypothetical protein